MFPHAELFARGQDLVARGARETGHMIHKVTGLHNELVTRNGKLAARASLDGELPVLIRKSNINHYEMHFHCV